ncbi:MAG TPA: Rrf2 family transcriptional regulator [Gemmatimonadales bacterium]|nr:Rrf2 family transcriptional regulator [Gemmatimonadales bacterium]
MALLYSSACGYAIRALTFLAEAGNGGFVQLRDIALGEDIPPAFLGKILQDLVHAGLLRSSKGPHGGYALARPATSISLLDIRQAIDGTADLMACASGLGRCSDDMPCPQHDRFKPVRLAMQNYLAATTVSGMATALARKRALLARERRSKTRKR